MNDIVNILLATEALGKKRQTTGTTAVATSNKQAGVTNTLGLSAMRLYTANWIVVVQQGQPDHRFKPAWINGGLQFSGCTKRDGLADLAFTELMPGKQDVRLSNGITIGPINSGELVTAALEQHEIGAGNH